MNITQKILVNKEPCVWWLRSIYQTNNQALGYVYYKGGISYSLCMTGNGITTICMI